jgi:alpha-glucosidase
VIEHRFRGKNPEVPENAWWEQAVVYQIYPRSFQDSDGDGIGDLVGVRQRLDHLVELGVDGLWLSPIYPSPNADWGYDVSDYTAVHPDFGSLDDFDALVEAAHERGLHVVLDLIPNHTSIEHPWFREHPDWYVWADERPNNWLSAFGGPAWSRDPETGRYYLHSFFPEQPDLDWRKPEVREAFGEIVRFWRGHAVDGFRVDAVDRISKDPQLRDDPPAMEAWLLPLPEEYGTLRHLHSRNAPGIERLLASLREAAGDTFLVGEVYRPTGELRPYLDCFDLLFAFEFMHAEWSAARFVQVLGPAHELGHMAWVLSNHDFTRLASRVGDANSRLAAALQLTLPGTAFVYQGDELGLEDGPGADPPFDRAGRDSARHPMQWEPQPGGGFTTGTPWLPLVDPERRSVAGQRGDPSSLLELYRELIRLRRSLGDGFELLGADPDVLAFRRGRYTVALNFGDSRRPVPPGEIIWSTDSVDGLAPKGAVIVG